MRATQEALPGMPAPPVQRTARAADPHVRYVKCRPRARTLCHDCVQAIQDLGWTKAPPPMAVRWKRTRDGEAYALLCEVHKRTRQEAGR